MRTKTYAEFSANFPDDTVEDETGIAQFGGRNMLEAISQTLTRLSYQVGEPEYAGEHGWELDVYAGKKRISLQLTQGWEGQPHILVTEAQAGLLHSLIPSRLAFYAEFLTRLDEGLQRDPRFGPVHWYPFASYGRGPAASDPLSVI